MNDTIVSAIASYGVRYRKEYLAKYSPETLLSNWWLALDFFFSRACYQGRRDAVSDKVYRAVVEVLGAHFTGDDRSDEYYRESQGGWEQIENELKARIGPGMSGKARDRKMIVAALAYIGSLPNLNIVAYSVDQIQQKLLDKHYVELQRSQSKGGIIQVGPKIAAFYLRDLVSLYSLDDLVIGDSAIFLQPIDVWVEKIARKIKIVDENANYPSIQKAIVARCQTCSISPILFNQGAWYVGSHAFDLMLDVLGAE